MTELRLYNTLTRQKERFEPIDANKVRMYVCGPTVYDFAHIGNARPVIVFDVVFRLLRHLYGKHHVTYVRNITDVEDKINARARRDFSALPLNEAISRVTQETTDQFHADVKALGCLEPTFQPRATQHIPGMIAMIGELLKRGHAYIATGKEGREVLFDVSSMPEYGQLSKRRLDEQQAGARVAVEAHKKNPEDFVLWKESSAEEPGWEAEFADKSGKTVIYGRPGWHIECSVMAEAHLGETFDIHGGGLDLIFPHHENEIAQSRCAHGTKFMAKTWMHNGYLQLEGRKMSKSEGNFVTIRDLLETEKFGGRKWPGEVLRLAMLMTHYRQPIDFSVKRLWEAEDILVQWSFVRDEILEPLNFQKLIQESGGPESALVEALADDVNTHLSISILQKLADETKSDPSKLSKFVASLDLLGIRPFEPARLNSDSEARRRLFDLANTAIDARLALLAEKNYAEADKIRAELAAKGIQLMDYKDPDTGERRTKWEVRR
jgi:cysteinyl-tRNA synthetase